LTPKNQFSPPSKKGLTIARCGKINHLRRFMWEKSGKSRSRSGKKLRHFSDLATAFSPVNPLPIALFPTFAFHSFRVEEGPARISAAVVESREATTEISQAHGAWKSSPKTGPSRRDDGSRHLVNSEFL